MYISQITTIEDTQGFTTAQLYHYLGNAAFEDALSDSCLIIQQELLIRQSFNSLRKENWKIPAIDHKKNVIKSVLDIQDGDIFPLPCSIGIITYSLQLVSNTNNTQDKIRLMAMMRFSDKIEVSRIRGKAILFIKHLDDDLINEYHGSVLAKSLIDYRQSCFEKSL